MSDTIVKELGGSNYATVEGREHLANVLMVHVGMIEPAADNPRRDVGDIDELAASIQANGIYQPLVVCYQDPRATGGPQYKLVIGHRRFAAAQKAGLTRVPVLVRRFSEQERLEAMLVENLQRSDLTALEEAGAFKTLTGMGLSQRDIATRIGRSQAHVSRRLALLELPEKAAEALDTGSITLDDAVEISKLADHPKALKAAMDQLDRNPAWLKHTVNEQLRNIEREKKKAAAIAKLKVSGIQRRKLPGPWTMDGAMWLLAPGNPYGGKSAGWNTMDLGVKEHEGEPCHAGYVDAEGYICYLCVEPARHGPEGASGVKLPAPPEDPEAGARDEAVIEAQRLREERIAAGEARGAFAKEFLNRGTFALRSSRALEALMEAWLCDDGYQQTLKRETVCELLDIEEVPTTEDGGPDYAEALRQWGREWGPSRTERLAVAIALTIHDSHRQMTPSHLSLLQSVGYQASTVELLEGNPSGEEAE